MNPKKRTTTRILTATVVNYVFTATAIGLLARCLPFTAINASMTAMLLGLIIFPLVFLICFHVQRILMLTMILLSCSTLFYLTKSLIVRPEVLS